ncbi:MAG: DNA polymerase I [candidate division Zixibacteria bacterium]|nr:DNA polymerase I [candidate division Zixibacteria bacterium]
MAAAARPRIFLIDGTALAYRAHFAFIRNPLRNAKGQITSAVYGVANSLLKIRREEKPDYWIFAFDRPEPTFRDEMYAEYKATRQPTPEDLVEQLPLVKEVAGALGCPLIEMAGKEADDLIATLASRAVQADLDVVIVSGDKDLLQLVNDRVTIYNPHKGGAEIERLDPAGVKEKFGVPPERVRDVLALMGDTSDNVPGVPGIGPKTAVELVNEYGDLESVLSSIPAIKRPALREKLSTHAGQARLSMRLVTLDTDCPIEWTPAQWQATSLDERAAARMFMELGFKSLVKWLGPDLSAPQPEGAASSPGAIVAASPGDTKGSYHQIHSIAELEQLVGIMRKAEWLAVDTETTSLSPVGADLVGISLSFAHGEAYYIPVGHDEAAANLPMPETLKCLRPVLTGEGPRLIAQNVKYDAQVFARQGIDLHPIGFDPMLASYCLDPGGRAHGLDALALQYCHHTMQPITELIGSGSHQKNFREVPAEQATYYSAEDSDYTFRLFHVLSPQLAPAGVDRLFAEIELPLAPVLGRMEQAGVRIDRPYLQELSKTMKRQIDGLERRIYDAAGEEFNLNSPVQLGHILFDVLKLSPGRKTAKTAQRATDVAVLEKLAAEHDVPRLMLEYRQLAKLKSTYVDALVALVHPATGRVHTSFHQAVAATGRLSSADPNLQNIPIRTEEGQKIRRAFVPRDDDHVLLVADYSQIELRLMAHFSQDQALLTAFRDAADVHARTAAEIFGIPEAEVTPAQRRLAKTANFGIIYGVSAYGLSQQSDMSMGEAKIFIEMYFKRYPGVKRFIEATIQQARQDGLVRTLFGRRRFLPDLSSSNRQRREFAERTAVNTPLQGTAADIIKKAMIEIDRRLRDGGKRSVMTLQVHDELVFDAHRTEIDRLSGMVKESMENAVTLDVPLVVDVGVGPNWLEAK